jgi:hypothetical protein
MGSLKGETMNRAYQVIDYEGNVVNPPREIFASQDICRVRGYAYSFAIENNCVVVVTLLSGICDTVYGC